MKKSHDELVNQELEKYPGYQRIDIDKIINWIIWFLVNGLVTYFICAQVYSAFMGGK